MAYLAPFTEPLRTETFHFNRRWLQRQAERVGDLRSPHFNTGRELNLPPQYLLVHRVTMGTLGVLCQLDADVPLRGIVRHWQPWIFDAEDERQAATADPAPRSRDAAWAAPGAASRVGCTDAARPGRVRPAAPSSPCGASRERRGARSSWPEPR